MAMVNIQKQLITKTVPSLRKNLLQKIETDLLQIFFLKS